MARNTTRPSRRGNDEARLTSPFWGGSVLSLSKERGGGCNEISPHPGRKARRPPHRGEVCLPNPSERNSIAQAHHAPARHPRRTERGDPHRGTDRRRARALHAQDLPSIRPLSFCAGRGGQSRLRRAAFSPRRGRRRRHAAVSLQVDARRRPSGMTVAVRREAEQPRTENTRASANGALPQEKIPALNKPQ